jgi:hypothetical protein
MKDKTINLRLTNELFNQLTFKATASGRNNSEYIREVINNSEIRVDNSKNINELLFQLNRIGNNLNQISKNLNIANNENSLNDVDYENLLNELTIFNYQLHTLSEEIK